MWSFFIYTSGMLKFLDKIDLQTSDEVKNRPMSILHVSVRSTITRSALFSHVFIDDFAYRDFYFFNLRMSKEKNRNYDI